MKLQKGKTKDTGNWFLRSVQAANCLILRDKDKKRKVFDEAFTVEKVKLSL
jgi:hypothetical protein